MKQIIKQLYLIRSIGRWLLLMQVVMWWGLLILGSCLALGVIDYFLHLPGWLRLLSICIMAIWLVQRFYRRFVEFLKFNPSLEHIALQVEDHHDQVKGSLASAVGMWERYSHKTQDIKQYLSLSASQQIISKMHGDSLLRVLNISKTQQAMWCMASGSGLLSLLIIFAPAWVQTSMGRWLLPFGQYEWPQKVYLQNLTTQTFVANDDLIHFNIGVEKGFSERMRVKLLFRFEDDQGQALTEWHEEHLNQQGFIKAAVSHEQVTKEWQSKQGTLNIVGSDYTMMLPRFEKSIDLKSYQYVKKSNTKIRYWMKSGDDTTPEQIIEIVDRPDVQLLRLNIIAPEYARRHVAERNLELSSKESGKSNTHQIQVLKNSDITLDMKATKLLVGQTIQERYPGLQDIDFLDHKNHETGDILKWKIKNNAQTSIYLQDRYGIKNVNITNEHHRYVFQIIDDQLPHITLKNPEKDISVLPSATLNISINAEDDIAISQLAILVDHPQSQSAIDLRQTSVVAKKQYDQQQAELIYSINMQELGIEPGNYLEVFGHAKDVHNTHDDLSRLVVSRKARINVIDIVTFKNQIRRDFAYIRQHATRAAELQTKQLELTHASQARKKKQKQISARIKRMSDLLQAIHQRVAVNNLRDSEINHIHDNADDMITKAIIHSQMAELQNENSNQHMEQVVNELANLISILSQGKDAAGLQMRLKQIEAIQDSISNDTRMLIPKTISRDQEEIDEHTRKMIEEVASRQKQLAQQTSAMMKQMQDLGEKLSKSEKPNQQAIGKAFKQAAAIAKRQALDQHMNEASHSIDKNQLSKAQNKQSNAQSILNQMMGAVQDHKQLKAMMLARKIREIADKIEQLIQDQKTEIQRIRQDNITPLAEKNMTVLRRRTLAVQQQGEDDAKQNPLLQSMVKALSEASTKQADAILAIRASNTPIAAQAEERALELLKQALERAQEAAQKEELQQLIEERQKLIDQYRQLADQQREVRVDTEDVLNNGVNGRKARIALLNLAKSEGEINDEANELKERVKDHAVFIYEHERIEKEAKYIIQVLRQSQVQQNENNILMLQQSIADSLDMMADVLEEQNKESKYAMNQSGSGAGQGGGAGQNQAKMIPPIAELRLLRAMQLNLNNQTSKHLNQAENIDELANRLATRQTELAQLGQMMVEKMKQKQVDNVPNQDSNVKSDVIHTDPLNKEIGS